MRPRRQRPCRGRYAPNGASSRRKNSVKLNPNLLKATVVGALGGLLFGFDTAVIAGTTHSLTLGYNLSSRQLGLTVSMALIGTVIGAMSAGIPGQKYGARETLRVLAVFYVLSALGCAFAWNWDALLLSRFLGGAGVCGIRVPWSRVHRGTSSGKNPRPTRRHVSDQHRHRYLAGIFVEFPNRAAGSWRDGVALAVRRSRTPGRAVSRDAVRHPAKPALVGDAKAGRGSAGSVAENGGGRSGEGAAGNR